MSWRSTGVVGLDELRDLGLVPSEERMRRGPVAVIECPEMIPCNVCVRACPLGAITKGKIYELPRLDEDRCTGCGVCVVSCPGLAIFVVDLSREGEAYVTVPYEMLPRPRKGARAILLDREGRPVGEGEVVRAWERDGTWAVTLRVPRDAWRDVRAVRILEG
ncbi:MAG: 4Fe-4S dicluster domain-containing protein [Desulfurococcaceae archaeon]